MLLFAAIASIVLGGIFAILTHGTKVIEIARRTSSSQTDLRVMLERMSEDAAELLYLEDTGPFDSEVSPAGQPFRFVVRSTRAEKGLSVPDDPSLRRVAYRVSPPDAETGLRELERKVTLLGPSAEETSGTLSQSLRRLRLWAVAAAPRPDRGFDLVSAGDARARVPGASVACLVAEVSLGRPAGEGSAESTPATTLLTRLWCRNRVLELPRGGLP